ncbi:MAG: RNA polymerase sigma factor [Acidobacteriota bacterium]
MSDPHLNSPEGHEELDPDRGVLERVAAGDTESFGVLVSRHQDRLFRLCERMLHDPEDAREAVQEVFLKAFRGAPRWRPRGQVYTWLYRIAVNHCLNRLRRRRLATFFSFGDLAPGDDDGPELDPADDGPDAEQRLRDRRRWNAAKKHIRQLPPSQQAVLVLARFEGLPYREIAETLGITEGAVESRLFRAVRRLGERLQVEAQESRPSRVAP